jgi:hypothetical protein
MTPEEANALIKTKVVHRMDYDDFERIVKEVYGHEFSLVAAEELGNDQSWTASVKKGDSRFFVAAIQNFKKTGDYQYKAAAILHDLVERDYLPEGDYVIDICW